MSSKQVINKKELFTEMWSIIRTTALICGCSDKEVSKSQALRMAYDRLTKKEDKQKEEYQAKRQNVFLEVEEKHEFDTAEQKTNTYLETVYCGRIWIKDNKFMGRTVRVYKADNSFYQIDNQEYRYIMNQFENGSDFSSINYEPNQSLFWDFLKQNKKNFELFEEYVECVGINTVLVFSYDVIKKVWANI